MPVSRTRSDCLIFAPLLPVFGWIAHPAATSLFARKSRGQVEGAQR